MLFLSAYITRPLNTDYLSVLETSTITSDNNYINFNELYYTAFLPHDAMRKRGLCCRPVSVRPSRWWIVFTHLKIVKLLSRPGSPIILVFLPTEPAPNYKEKFLSWNAKYTTWEKITILYRNRHLSPNRHEISPWLLWNVNRKSWVSDRSVSVPMT